ncbi:VOC family protein [Bdellovibrio svalbardensis]|uniref:VOC family protein n=1 Tax=Bdellovibrio svalbardensis TaxID=2972972 RepID=A0ABT6DQT9_9BACT|nr:VOC family protein [Bdellovibrio svalbardensis]MDG0818191.1 VOC family protein [Bdellovibrio svalbardensis]
MKGNAVGWFEIYVDDMTRAKKFYESVFSTTLERLNNPEVELWSFPGNVNSYGAPGALVKIPGVAAGGNSVLVYFSCADCSLEEKRVTEFGGKVEKSKFAIGQYGFISLVYDTEGNMFGLHSMN